MKTMHWSQVYLSFVTIEVTYSDSARQGWDYDCSQFSTVEDMKLNMAADFNDPRADWSSLMLYVTHNENSWSGEITVPELTTGEDFMTMIFEQIEDMLTWQPVEIS